MYVHRSNSLEELVDCLREVLDEAPDDLSFARKQVEMPQQKSAPVGTEPSGQGSPRHLSLGILDPEMILIQSAGMERYLSRELARRRGIVANVKFPFPRAFLRDIIDKALGKDERSLAFEREQMATFLFAYLAQVLDEKNEAFSAVRKHLQGDADNTRRLLLAERLANLFDQYLTYRPEMMQAWQGGAGEEDFQAILWRQLVGQFGNEHFAARCYRFMNELSEEEQKDALPKRVCLLGGPGLPPLFLNMLSCIGRVVPTHLFSFSVSQQYFAGAHQLDNELSQESEKLQPLLLSLGKVGADYQHILEDVGHYQEGRAQFLLEKLETPTVLSTLQQSVVEGRVELSDMEERRSSLLTNLALDDSLTIDSCHSPLREVEVLHDRLLSWFAQDATLRPEDIVVLAPNIEEYSPLINGVFSARSGERPPIPFRIADRSEKYTNAAARALLMSLKVLRGRFKATDVLDLLQQAPVAYRFEMDHEALEKVSHWVKESGIRWGADAHHKTEYGLPANDENTWTFGLRRLLLGYALADDGDQIWQGVVPLDQVAAGDIGLVGRLCDYCEGLFALRRRLVQGGERGLSPLEWSGFLSDLSELLLGESPAGEWDHEAVRNAIYSLGERFSSLVEAFTQDEDLRMGLAGVDHLLSAALDECRPSTDFLAGGVTFCALLPLRTIPFRGVCVLGMNQGHFPRADTPHQLDRMSESPQYGDRSLRADDRYLFLEVILAARERLSLSFVGRSAQDNSEKSPSTILIELQGVVESLLGTPSESTAALSRILNPTEHRLQPFHPDYFISNALMSSFDKGAYEGAQALMAPQEEVETFFDDPESHESEEEIGESLHSVKELESSNFEMTLDDLIRFWKSPSSAYLAGRGIRFDEDFDSLDDRETIKESALCRYIVGNRQLGRLLLEKDIRPEIELARGQLPIGQGGEVLFDEVTQVVQEIHGASMAFRGREKSRSAPVSQRLSWQAADISPYVAGGLLTAQNGSILLTGHLDQIYGASRVEVSNGQLKAGRLLSLWFRHLAACAQNEPIEQSVLVVRASSKSDDSVKVLAFRALDPPRAQSLLAQLCALAFWGIKHPLRFFPLASQEYYDSWQKLSAKSSEDEPAKKSLEKCRKNLSGAGSVDASILQLYRGQDPLGEKSPQGEDLFSLGELKKLPFTRLAHFVFGPLEQAKVKPKIADSINEPMEVQL